MEGRRERREWESCEDECPCSQEEKLNAFMVAAEATSPPALWKAFENAKNEGGIEAEDESQRKSVARSNLKRLQGLFSSGARAVSSRLSLKAATRLSRLVLKKENEDRVIELDMDTEFVKAGPPDNKSPLAKISDQPFLLKGEQVELVDLEANSVALCMHKMSKEQAQVKYAHISRVSPVPSNTEQYDVQILPNHSFKLNSRYSWSTWEGLEAKIPPKGKWYFEVTVHSPSDAFQIGWICEKYQKSSMYSGQGIGDCSQSWAFDGARQCIWHNGRQDWGARFNPTHSRVIGCAIDLNEKSILFSYGGKWEEPMGVAFKDIPVSKKGWFAPGISGQSGSSFEVNYGFSGFVHEPPSKEYNPISKAVFHSQGDTLATKDFPMGRDNGVNVTTTDEGTFELDMKGDFPTWILPEAELTSGKWYYEVKVNKMTRNIFQVGWVTSSFPLPREPQGSGVGDFENSWAYDGGRKKKWNAGSQPYGAGYQGSESKVVGCALDLDNKTISFSYKGSWRSPMGVAFTNINVPEGCHVSPGVTGHGGAFFEVNLGTARFAYKIPNGHKPVSACLPVVAEASALETLSLTRVDVAFPLVTSLLSNPSVRLGNLTALHLEGNRLDRQPTKIVRRFANWLGAACPSLTEISLRDNMLDPGTLRLFVPLLAKVEKVLLDKNRLAGYHGGLELANLIHRAENMRILSVRNNYLGDSGGAKLLEAVLDREVHTLQHLCLEDNELADEAWAAFSNLSNKGSSLALESVSLSHNPSLFSALHAPEGMCALKELNLGWCRAGSNSDDIEKLVGILRWAPQLERLGLDGARFAPEAFVDLVRVISAESKNLQALHLRGAALSEDVIQELISCVMIPGNKLRFLDLAGCTSPFQGAELYVHVAEKLFEAHQNGWDMRFPCVRLHHHNSKQHTSSMLEEFVLTVTRSNFAQAFLSLFEKEWILEPVTLPMVTYLHKWALSLLSPKLKDDELPFVRFQGNIAIDGANLGGASIFRASLPPRTMVTGSASFKNCHLDLDGVDKFIVRNRLWISECESLTSIPDTVFVGKGLVLGDCGVKSVRACLLPGVDALKELRLFNLPFLSALPSSLVVQDLVLVDCNAIKQIPDTLQVREKIEIFRCDGIVRVPACGQLSVVLYACAAVEHVQAPTLLSFKAMECPRLQSTPCADSLATVIVQDCASLRDLDGWAETIIVENCPLASLEVHRGKDVFLPSLTLINNPLVEIPDGVTISKCTILFNEKLEQLSECYSNVLGTLAIRHCDNLRKVPSKLKCSTLHIANCASFESLSNLLLDHSKDSDDSEESDTEEDEVEDLEDATFLQSLTITRCPKFRELCFGAKVDDVNISYCKSVESIPVKLQAVNLKLSYCSGLVFLGGTPQKSLYVVSELEVDHCRALERIGWLKTKNLQITSCMAFKVIEKKTMVEECSFQSVGLIDLPDEFVETTGEISTNARIPVARQARLQEMASSLGHEITWSDEDPQFETLQQAVLYWERQAEVEVDERRHGLEKLVSNYYSKNLLQFFQMLSESAEFQQMKTRVGLARRVIEVIDTLVENEECRDEILTRLADSVDQCNDKPIWALNQAITTTQIFRARGNKAKLRELGHALMRLGVVHKHAEKKLRELGSGADDVCVYLKFEVELRELLDLPTSSKKMQFSDYYSLNDGELQAAVDEALAITQEDLDIWLREWTEWQRQLRLEYAETIVWADLPEFEQSKRISMSATTMLGEELTEPVMLGRSGPFQFSELLDRWVSTGMDFSNVPWTLEAFAENLKRISNSL